MIMSRPAATFKSLSSPKENLYQFAFKIPPFPPLIKGG